MSIWCMFNGKLGLIKQILCIYWLLIFGFVLCFVFCIVLLEHVKRKAGRLSERVMTFITIKSINNKGKEGCFCTLNTFHSSATLTNR